MFKQRFPAFLSAPSVVAAVFSIFIVFTALFILGNLSPFWLMARDPSTSVAFYMLLAFATLCIPVLYILVAPRIYRFSMRYTPQAQGTQRLPETLVSACLKDMDFACPSCTYNLKGLQQPTCPECNAPVVVYLYGTEKVSTRWTGLIICWLALDLVAAAITLGAVWGGLMDVLGFSNSWYGYNESTVSVIGITAFIAVLVCAWRAVALAVPKPPHKQSICIRRTAVWLAAISAACALAIAIVFGRQILRWWY